MNLSKDLISGQEIGPYKIVFLEYLPKEQGKKRKGKFICPYDNTVFECVVHDVNNGKTRSCGCYKKKNTSRLYKENLLGKRFGHLTIIGEATNSSYNKTRWHCKCDCGREKDVITQLLKEYRTTTCGNKDCPYFHKLKQEKRRAKIENRRFGKLTVKNIVGQDKDNNFLWSCDCDCGTKNFITTANSLLSGNTKSCGCLVSYYEEKIGRILDSLNYNYIPQKSFKDCINPATKKKLRFDFYLPDYNLCIEYNGKQHYESTSEIGWNTPEALKDLQKRDNIKKEYCAKNNIKLWIIPYWEQQNINEEYIQKNIEEEDF